MTQTTEPTELGPMMPATEVIKRLKESGERLAGLAAKDPLAFVLAVDAISKAQWESDERRFARQHQDAP